MMTSKLLPWLASSTAFLWASHSLAQQGDLQWHGFVSQGVIQAEDSALVNKEGDASLALTELGMNFSWQINDRLRLAGQGLYINGGNRYDEGLRLDYFLLDIDLWNDDTHSVDLYLGRSKNHHWFYSSTRDTAFTRPDIYLPQSVYFDAFRDIALASDGIALGGNSLLSFAELEWNWSYGDSPISQETTDRFVGDIATGRLEQDFVHQLSAKFHLHQWPVTLGVSLLDSDFTYKSGAMDVFPDSDVDIRRVMLMGRYSGEKWEVTTEILKEWFRYGSRFMPGFGSDLAGDGGYIQVNRHLNQTLSLKLGYDLMFPNRDDRDGDQLSEGSGGFIPSYFAYSKDFSLGFSWNISDKLKLVGEHHWIKGRARTAPVVLPDVINNKGESWTLWALQLSYWF